MRIDRRLSAWATAGVLLVAVVGGWLLRRSDGDIDATLRNPGLGDDLILDINEDVRGMRFPDVSRQRVSDGTIGAVLAGGRPTVVNFWYTTCPPCRREMPVLGDAARAYAGRVDFVGINPLDPRDSASEFLQRAGAEFETYLDPQGELMTELRVTTMPITLFLDSDGMIVATHAGEITSDDIASVLADNFGIGP